MKALWPETPFPTVYVYVDWLNVYLSQFTLFQGKPGVDVVMDQILNFARQLGTETQITIYLSISEFKVRHSKSWGELQQLCTANGARIVDVPGKQVADQMITDLGEFHCSQSPAIPVLVVTKNLKLEEALVRIGKDRPVYVAVPNGQRKSALTRTLCCRWLHSLANRNIATWDMLSQESGTTETRISHCRAKNPTYGRTYEMIELIIHRLAQIKPGTRFDIVLQQLRRENMDLELDQGVWAYYLKAFAHYEVIDPWETGLHLRDNHLAFIYFGVKLP